MLQGFGVLAAKGRWGLRPRASKVGLPACGAYRFIGSYFLIDYNCTYNPLVRPMSALTWV